MIKKTYNFFFSLEFALFLSLIFIVSMGAATLLKTDLNAWQYVYGTKWFELIMWFLGFNLIGVMFKYKTYKRVPIFILHLSVLIILLGAAITRYFGYEGNLHLRNGESANQITVIKNKAKPTDIYVKKLGFTVKLDKFVLRHYPGSMQPSSYDSYVTIIDGDKKFKYHIFMNHILVYKGYRFYQASYDPDGMGSILSVNHDPGMYITYLGYLLMAIGFFASMFYKKSRFMITIKKLKTSGLFALLLFILIPYNLKAFDVNSFAKNSKSFEKVWEKILVQKSGRIEPMDTLDLDLIHKITKKYKLMGMDYNQLVMGMLAFPSEFQKLPLIYVGHPLIRKQLKLKGKYAPYIAFFNENGDFKFSKEINKAFNTPDAKRSQVDREWIKLNERVYVSFMIYTAQIFKIFPTPNSKKMNYMWFSPYQIQQSVMKGMMDPFSARAYLNSFNLLVESIKRFDLDKLKKAANEIYDFQKTYTPKILPDKNKIEWEIKYNHLQIFPMLIGIYSTLGLLIIILGFVEVLKLKKYPKIEVIFVILGALALLSHTFNMGLRWYVAGHAPWSDAYESIIFIAWGAAFASLVFFRKSMLALGAGLFVAGMFMMVAHLNNIDPQITNLVPVLKSYWLLIHVAVITSSYGFLAVGSMLGLLNLILFAINKEKLQKQIKEFNNIIYIALYIGLALLSIGTFLGGVWANESWGRYWSWDPKETWSLISMVVYAVVVHSKMMPKLRGEFIFSLLAFLSFFFILMTYFGVNFYIAQGLHSYGQGVADGYWWIKIIFAGMGAWFAVVILGLIMILYQKINKPIEIKHNEYSPKV